MTVMGCIRVWVRCVGTGGLVVRLVLATRVSSHAHIVFPHAQWVAWACLRYGRKTVGVRYTAPAPVVAGVVARTAAGGSLREALIASRPVAQCGVRWCVCGVAPCWSAVVCVWTMHTSADPITPETDAGARKFGHADGSHWRLAFRAPYTPSRTCRARARTSGSALTIRADGWCSRFGYTPPPKARIAGTAKSSAAVLFN